MHNRQLVVTGRSKDIIFVNGQNYYPHDLENIAIICQKLELGKVVACGISQDVAKDSQLLIFILHRGDLGDFITIAKEVSILIGEHMGLEVTKVIPVKRIPKTTGHWLAVLSECALGEIFSAALSGARANHPGGARCALCLPRDRCCYALSSLR